MSVVESKKSIVCFPMVRWSVSRVVLCGFFLMAFFSSLQAQKNSLWTGEGTEPKKWTDAENWDTEEDPNGNDTAFIPENVSLTLDAKRTVGRLVLQGVTGKPVNLTSATSLTVHNRLGWNHAVLNGMGTFTGSSINAISGIADFGLWDVTLSGETTLRESNVRALRKLDMNGMVVIKEGVSISGSSDIAVNGTLVKRLDTPGNDTTSFSDPGQVVTNNGTIEVENGALVFQGEVRNGENATYAAASGGALLFRSGSATFSGARFDNDGTMTITDSNDVPDGIIEFQGTNTASGSQPVSILAADFVTTADAVFDSVAPGKWLWAGGKQLGFESDFASNRGVFHWSGGTLSAFTNLEGAELIIEHTQGQNSRNVQGVLINRGQVEQRSDVVLGGEMRGEVRLAKVSTWEMQGAVSISPAVGGAETGGIEAGAARLLHVAERAGDAAAVSVGMDMEGGSIENRAGRLSFRSIGLTNTQVLADNLAELDSKIAFREGLLRNVPIRFLNDGTVAVESELRVDGNLTGTGRGSMVIDAGVMRFEKASSLNFGEESTLLVNSTRDDNEAMQFVLGLTPNDDMTIRVENQGRISWMKGAWVRDHQQSDLQEAVLANFGVIELDTGGSKELDGVTLENIGEVSHGGGNGTQLTMAGSPAVKNFGLYQFTDDGGLRPKVALPPSASALPDFVNSGDLFADDVEGASAPGRMLKSGGTRTSSISVKVKNEGIVECRSGVLKFSVNPTNYNAETKTLSGGTWIATSPGKLQFGQNNARSIEVLSGCRVTIAGPDADFLNTAGVSFFSRSGLRVGDASDLIIGEGAMVDFGGPVTIGPNSTLGGTGLIGAPELLFEGGAFVSPGDSPGTLDVSGKLTLATGSVYAWEANATAHDTITVQGEVELGAVLRPEFLEGYLPSEGTQWTILTASSITGDIVDVDRSLIASSGLTVSVSNTGTALIATVQPFGGEGNDRGYETFLERYFDEDERQDPEVVGRLADPDRDGIENLRELAHGLHPGVPNPEPVRWVYVCEDGSRPCFLITFPWDPAASGLRFTPLVGPELTALVPSAYRVVSEVVVDDRQEITIEVMSPTDSERGFARLRIDEEAVDQP